MAAMELAAVARLSASASSSCMLVRHSARPSHTAAQRPLAGLSLRHSLSSKPQGALQRHSHSLSSHFPVVCSVAPASREANTSAAAVDTFSEDLFDGEEWEEVPVHTVKVHDRQRGVTYEFDVPQDQYILHTAEEAGIKLPFACRHGCCTACAVRIRSGELTQPRALGISPELKEKGYALMCVGVPLSDLEVETQDEDEVYWQQFGKYFARGPVERDDYALELAMQDE